MTNAEFLDLVARMRQAQRDFYATRYPALMIISIRLEREVDVAVKEMKKQLLRQMEEAPSC